MFIFITSQIDSEKNLSNLYQRLALLYCYIDDYPAWLEQQFRLNYFLQFAQFFYIDTNRIEQELEQYRLQRERLKAVERLPIIIGNG
jgi:hypothetical protein